MSSYRIINLITAGVLILIFSYSGFFISTAPESGISCNYKMLTGLDCATCGFTRDFNALLSFSEAPLLNGFSLSVFVFFLIQLLVRIILIVFGLDYNQNKFVVALDLGITIVHFLIVFIPILIASTNQTLSLL